MATIYNFQKAATLEDDNLKYWNKHYCVNQAGDSSGEYVPLADYSLVTTQRDTLLAACQGLMDWFIGAGLGEDHDTEEEPPEIQAARTAISLADTRRGIAAGGGEE